MAKKPNFLILWGDEDKIIPVQQTESWRKFLPQADIKVFKGAGHLVHDGGEAVDLGLQGRRIVGQSLQRAVAPDVHHARHRRALACLASGDQFLFSVTKGQSVSLWIYSLRDGKTAPFGDVRVITTHIEYFSLTKRHAQIEALGPLLRTLRERGFARVVLIHHPPLPGLAAPRLARPPQHLTDVGAALVAREALIGRELIVADLRGLRGAPPLPAP